MAETSSIPLGAVITALTAQNTQGVQSFQTVDPRFVAEQIDAIFADVRVDAVKIGIGPAIENGYYYDFDAFDQVTVTTGGADVKIATGGVGINLAIQDAVATANILAAKLKAGSCRDDDLDAVRRRRLFPVKVVQAFQVAVQNRLLKPRISGEAVAMTVPWPLKLLNASAWARRWPAQFLGVGVRPEHVRSPKAP